MPFDVAAGVAGCDDGRRVWHGDVVGVGLDCEIGGLASVREADLDALAADHDGAAS
jgi:hypothetical protein